MEKLLLAKTVSPTGEVTDRIDLDRWRLAARDWAGLTLTDGVAGTNPFTHAAIVFPRPGSGVWVHDGREHRVLFDCGAVVIDDCTPVDARLLESLAERVGGSVGPYTPGIFAAERMILSTLLRRAIVGLPSRAQLFTAGLNCAVSTPTLLLEPSDAVADVRVLAATLGFPDLLLPIECVEQVAESAKNLDANPSDGLLIRALEYFLDHDAFLEEK